MWSIAPPVLIAGAALSLALAAPAAADTAGYLHELQASYPTVGAQQLVSEGTKVCSAIRGGMNSTQAVVMVMRDIGVSVPAAGAIGLQTTLWLLDEAAATKLRGQPG